jgi:uncharacterized membrane protein YiaA
MEIFQTFIYFIIFLKVLYLSSVICIAYYKLKYKKNTENIEYYNKIQFFTNIKDQIEFIVTILMAIVLIVLFNPRYNKKIEIFGEVKYLLFLFGIILILTSNWSIFIQNSYILHLPREIKNLESFSLK